MAAYSCEMEGVVSASCYFDIAVHLTFKHLFVCLSLAQPSCSWRPHIDRSHVDFTPPAASHDPPLDLLAEAQSMLMII